MKRSAIIALFIAFFAFTAADIVSRAIFERLPRLEDEFAYLYQARIFARGNTYIDTPTPIRAYWQPFLISAGGKRFGKYTPGWPLLLAPGAAWDQPWIVNAWLAMLTAAVVYRLGREVYGEHAGVIAAALTAISPAALLLSGTLMGHTAALLFTTLFMLALWQIEKRRKPFLWAIIGGASLGMVVITRPLTGAGIAAPFVLYSLGRVIAALLRNRQRDFWPTFNPLLVLGVASIAVSMLWPAFNYSVTGKAGESFPSYMKRFLQGDPKTNLYLYIWNYDKIGFGPGHGNPHNGYHTMEKAKKHARQDLACSARDLFGWASPSADGLTVDQESRRDNSCLTDSGRGYSWLLMPLGLLLGLRKRGGSWRSSLWTLLLFAVPISIVGVHLTYWIGAGVYSARYYFEALTAVALLSAVAVVGLIDLIADLIRWQKEKKPPAVQWVVYGTLAALILFSVIDYSPARLNPLKGYGRIHQSQINQLNAMRRDPDRPVAVIVWGDHHWRDIAAFMAVTDPYLDSDIIVARDQEEQVLDNLLDRWRNREIIYFTGGRLQYNIPNEGS